MTRVTISDALPAVLSTTELAAVLGVTRGRVWQLEKRGALRFLELDPRICERARYSGRKVRAYLDGALAAPEPTPAPAPSVAPTHDAPRPAAPRPAATTRRRYFGAAQRSLTRRTEP